MWTFGPLDVRRLTKFSPTPYRKKMILNLSIMTPTTSGGSDTIVPEVLESENDDMIVENESPRGIKYNVRPNPTPNFTDEYRY